MCFIDYQRHQKGNLKILKTAKSLWKRSLKKHKTCKFGVFHTFWDFNNIHKALWKQRGATIEFRVFVFFQKMCFVFPRGADVWKCVVFHTFLWIFTWFYHHPPPAGLSQDSGGDRSGSSTLQDLILVCATYITLDSLMEPSII